MKTRIHQWLDTKRLRPMFGIQVRHGGKWHHAHRDGKPLIFASREHANAERKRIAPLSPDTREG